MDWKKLIFRFFLGLIPRQDDDVVKMTKWRWRAVVLGLSGLVIACYGANFIPGLKPSYAMTGEVIANKNEITTRLDKTDKKVESIEKKVDGVIAQNKRRDIRDLNNDLLDARRFQCRAILSGDRSALPFWNNRITDLKFDYQALTGQPWSELACNSF